MESCCGPFSDQTMPSMDDYGDMEVQVILATTGETVYTSVYSEVNDLQVWELRVHICHALDSAEYFSFMLFQGPALLDDTAFVSDYREAARENKLQIYLIVRELRPPTDEETGQLSTELK